MNVIVPLSCSLLQVVAEPGIARQPEPGTWVVSLDRFLYSLG